MHKIWSTRSCLRNRVRVCTGLELTGNDYKGGGGGWRRARSKKEYE